MNNFHLKYTVIITNNNCSETSECIALTTSGIIESTFNKEISLYPNPTTGLFSIDMVTIHKEIFVKINDISGKEISNKIYKNQKKISIDLKETKGIYFIEVSSEKEKAVYRLVKN